MPCKTEPRALWERAKGGPKTRADKGSPGIPSETRVEWAFQGTCPEMPFLQGFQGASSEMPYP